MTRSGSGGRLVKRHSLSIAAAGLLRAWILLYARANPRTHLGSFFGSADWTGVVVTIIATKYLFEIGSKARRHPSGPFRSRLHDAGAYANHLSVARCNRIADALSEDGRQWPITSWIWPVPPMPALI